MNNKDAPICVDARMVGKNGTGTTTYAHGLIAAAAALGHRFLLLEADHQNDSRFCKLLGALKTEHMLRESKSDCEQVTQNKLVGRDIFRRAHVHFTFHRRFLRLKPPLPFGVMHWTYPVPMRMEGWINIYTVHDLIPLMQPHLSPVSGGRHRAIMHELRRNADRIVTVSATARSEIISLLRVEEALVVNCGQAVLGTVDNVRSRPPLGLQADRYFIFCGAIEPRKNLTRLIKAYAVSGVEWPLIIAGPDGWGAAEINSLIDRTPNVIRSGFLERGELLALIRCARGLLFPSLAEGFGLPVAEAMRLGTAVLTSSIEALAEVAGNAAVLVDPFDINAIARGIRQLAFDKALVTDLSARGLLRAERFSLPHFTAQLTAVYDDALAAYSGPAKKQALVQ